MKQEFKSVYWEKGKPFFEYSEATLTHLTKDRIKTKCGMKIGVKPKFNIKIFKNEECKRCFIK